MVQVITYCMKLISWNVNGLRAVEKKGELNTLLTSHDPDILLLQEIKGNDHQFSPELRFHPSYNQYYFSAEKGGYAGTGIWVKKNPQIEILEFITGMPDFEDKEGRVSRVSMKIKGKKYEIFSIYFPNGGKSPEAWKGKLVFYDIFLNYLNDLRKKGLHCIWAGDINCAHEEIDIARPKENDGNIGFHPKERAWVSKCIQQGWIDIFRKMYPNVKDVYSWWDQLTRARERNVGWRLDYFFCDKDFYPQVKNISYLNEQMGSDHCPVRLDLAL